MSDIVLVLDKMELLIQAVSEINKNGKYSTEPADKEHQNSFLKIDRYATFFENFLKNFWRQLKDPTHFGLFTMKEEEFDKPEVKQAIEDLAEGKKTKAVEEFLKKYEITPKNQTEQSINNQNSEEMAKKNSELEEAYDVLDKLSADEKKRLEYERRQRAIRDYNIGMLTAERRGIEADRKIGMEEGREEGRIEGVNRINQLNIELSKLGRTEDILKAAVDKEYQEKLLKEFEL